MWCCGSADCEVDQYFLSLCRSSLFSRGQLAGGTTLIKEDLSLKVPSLTQVNREGPQDQKMLQYIGTIVNFVLQISTKMARLTQFTVQALMQRFCFMLSKAE